MPTGLGKVKGYWQTFMFGTRLAFDDECFACRGTGTFEPCADEPPDRPTLTCAECGGTGPDQTRF